jgi:UPF0716 protein FxsA
VPVLLVAALVIVPIVEIWLLLQVGQLLGVLQTVVLLVAMSLLGAYLLRREGARAWQAFRTALASGRLPAKEVADGALVILGGALLLTPGFATDAFGLLCVLPPTRAVLRRLLTQQVARRLTVGAVLGGGRRPSSSRRRPADTVVDGEVVRPPDDPGRPSGTLPPA